MRAIVVIPARLSSTRFPEKVLADATGRPLVQHVVDRARLSRRADRVIVAADDVRVVRALEAFNTEVILTRVDHPSGTDRIAEVARKVGADIYVNVQGDEPEVEPEAIDGLIERLEQHPDESMATAAAPFPVGADPHDPNLVKVVLNTHGCAIYFSRSRIPANRDNPSLASGCLLHRGLYAFRHQFLLDFASRAPTPLEQLEKLEQLRAIEHGDRIGVIMTAHSAPGIDTPEQYRAFVERYRSNNDSIHARVEPQASAIHAHTPASKTTPRPASLTVNP